VRRTRFHLIRSSRRAPEAAPLERALSTSSLAAIVALSGPGREEEQDLGAPVAADEVALVRLKVDERAYRRVNFVASRTDPCRSVHHDHPRVLLYLVLPELLARVEADEHRTRLVLAQENDRRAAAIRCRDLRELPALHGERESNLGAAHAVGFSARRADALVRGCRCCRRMARARVVMLGNPGPDYQSPATHREVCAHARRWSAVPFVIDGLHVFVDDVDAHFERARAAGATILSELEDTPFGDRHYRVEDIEGHRCMFGQRVRDVAPEEWGATVA
jgi:hypothetical protein